MKNTSQNKSLIQWKQQQQKNWPRGALYLISFISVFNLATSTQHKQISANNAL